MITTPRHKSLALYAFLLFISTTNFAQIHVNASASAGGDGTSWANAYNSLTSALSQAATSGGEIWVAAGTYTTGGQNSSFTIPSGVAVYGGFNGTETNRGQRDWEINITSLDGDNSTRKIVYLFNSNSSTILDGFVIENGNGSSGGSGAGIYIDADDFTSASPQISNCLFSNNSAQGNGGAAMIVGTGNSIVNPIFKNCAFNNNYSGIGGGAVYIDGSNGTSNTKFEDCVFYQNQCAQSGGALFCQGQTNGDASSEFIRCDFDENSTINDHGGAIYSVGNGLGKVDHTFKNCRFYKNAGNSAGALYNNSGSGSASCTITNCTFYGNTTGPSGTGGAVYSNADGGGQSSTKITNSIIWGNTGNWNTHVLKNVKSTPTISYSIVDAPDCNSMQGGDGGTLTCGAGMQYNTDPLFENAATGNLHLSASSTAIDNGAMGEDYGSMDLDQNPRVIGTVDLGPYESAALLPVELAYFQVQKEGRKAALKWATFSEDRNDFFVVERSADGVQFYPIARLEGAGTSSDFQTYKSLDLNPLPGDNYYRVKDVAYNGNSSYSPIKIINFGAETVSIYPNPVKDHIQVAFAEDNNFEDAKFEVYSIYGQLIFAGRISADGANTSIEHPQLTSLVPGQYILSIRLAGAESLHKRFMKK